MAASPARPRRSRSNRLDEAGDQVRATMSDGSVGDYDLVIGADGLHSRVRDLTLPQAPKPAYAGQVIWRMGGRCPAGLDRYTIMVAGPTRIGLVPLPGDELYLWRTAEPGGPEAVGGHVRGAGPAVLTAQSGHAAHRA